MPLTSNLMDRVNQDLAADPDLAAAVETTLEEMRVEQALVALREKRHMTQQQLAARLGVKQPVIAKIEAGKSRNIGLRTLVRAVRAMGGQVTITITEAPVPRARTTPRRRRA